MIKNQIALFLIPLAAFASLFTYRYVPSTKAIFQILIIFVIASLILLRKANISSFLKYKLFQNLLYTSITFFTVLLVIATGGFLSPFFILVHLTTLGLSFLFSLGASITFLTSAIIVASLHLYYFYPVDYRAVDNVLLIVYLLSLVTIIPITFFIARRYDLSNKLADYLNKQLFITQTEKNLLLGTIQEGVISTDPNLKITNLNSMAQKLIKLDESTVKNKPFFDVFSFKNQYGAEIKKQNLPLENLLKVQASFKKENVNMNVSNGITLQKINATFSSNVDEEGKVTGILFVFNDLTKEVLINQIQNVIEVSFKKFLTLPENNLKKAISFLHLLYQFQNEKFNETLQLSDVSEIIKKQTQIYKDSINLLFDQKIQTELKIGSEKKIATTSSVHPLSIVTNKTILENSLFCVISLALDINPEKTPVSIDTKLGDQILIIITTNTQIATDEIAEIFKPFFGKLENNSSLINTSGLEGYIAKIFLEEIGGNISAAQEPAITFTINLPYIKK